MTYEKEADPLALAAHLQEQLNMAGRRACEQALVPQTPKDEKGKHLAVLLCVECEVELPPVRIVMGRVRCTPCQIDEDKRLKQLRRS